ncbi:putative esophageal gland cell secretory protein 6 [Aphelenchoides bicaudatus]|nr:putative esophageal gland cell secretory protein 6 [Aphelenchoides bicaudatus]
MHKFTKIVLFTLAIISVFEVLSDSPQEKSKGHSEDEHDAFREFDDPADKYTQETQNDQAEHLEIRAPSGSDSNTPSKTFIPPMNMPPIRFAYCVSCGYKNAFEQYSQVIHDKYPTIQIEGANYSPGALKSLLAQFLGFAKIGLIIAIVMERNPFTFLGMNTPAIFNWMLSNKLSACLMLFMFSNSIESMLLSTGAFEIYIGDEQIWSKLESGRVPSPGELNPSY